MDNLDKFEFDPDLPPSRPDSSSPRRRARRPRRSIITQPTSFIVSPNDVLLDNCNSGSSNLSSTATVKTSTKSPNSTFTLNDALRNDDEDDDDGNDAIQCRINGSFSLIRATAAAAAAVANARPGKRIVPTSASRFKMNYQNLPNRNYVSKSSFKKPSKRGTATTKRTGESARGNFQSRKRNSTAARNNRSRVSNKSKPNSSSRNHVEQQRRSAPLPKSKSSLRYRYSINNSHSNDKHLGQYSGEFYLKDFPPGFQFHRFTDDDDDDDKDVDWQDDTVRSWRSSGISPRRSRRINQAAFAASSARAVSTPVDNHDDHDENEDEDEDRLDFLETGKNMSRKVDSVQQPVARDIRPRSAGSLVDDSDSDDGDGDDDNDDDDLGLPEPGSKESPSNTHNGEPAAKDVTSPSTASPIDDNDEKDDKLDYSEPDNSESLSGEQNTELAPQSSDGTIALTRDEESSLDDSHNIGMNERQVTRESPFDGFLPEDYADVLPQLNTSAQSLQVQNSKNNDTETEHAAGVSSPRVPNRILDLVGEGVTPKETPDFPILTENKQKEVETSSVEKEQLFETEVDTVRSQTSSGASDEEKSLQLENFPGKLPHSRACSTTEPKSILSHARPKRSAAEKAKTRISNTVGKSKKSLESYQVPEVLKQSQAVTPTCKLPLVLKSTASSPAFGSPRSHEPKSNEKPLSRKRDMLLADIEYFRSGKNYSRLRKSVRLNNQKSAVIEQSKQANKIIVAKSSGEVSPIELGNDSLQPTTENQLQNEVEKEKSRNYWTPSLRGLAREAVELQGVLKRDKRLSEANVEKSNKEMTPREKRLRFRSNSKENREKMTKLDLSDNVCVERVEFNFEVADSFLNVCSGELEKESVKKVTDDSGERQQSIQMNSMIPNEVAEVEMEVDEDCIVPRKISLEGAELVRDILEKLLNDALKGQGISDVTSVVQNEPGTAEISADEISVSSRKTSQEGNYLAKQIVEELVDSVPEQQSILHVTSMIQVETPATETKIDEVCLISQNTSQEGIDMAKEILEELVNNIPEQQSISDATSAVQAETPITEIVVDEICIIPQKTSQEGTDLAKKIVEKLIDDVPKQTAVPDVTSMVETETGKTKMEVYEISVTPRKTSQEGADLAKQIVERIVDDASKQQSAPDVPFKVQTETGRVEIEFQKNCIISQKISPQGSVIAKEIVEKLVDNASKSLLVSDVASIARTETGRTEIEVHEISAAARKESQEGAELVKQIVEKLIDDIPEQQPIPDATSMAEAETGTNVIYVASRKASQENMDVVKEIVEKLVDNIPEQPSVSDEVSVVRAETPTTEMQVDKICTASRKALQEGIDLAKEIVEKLLDDVPEQLFVPDLPPMVQTEAGAADMQVDEMETETVAFENVINENCNVTTKTTGKDYELAREIVEMLVDRVIESRFLPDMVQTENASLPTMGSNESSEFPKGITGILVKDNIPVMSVALETDSVLVNMNDKKDCAIESAVLSWTVSHENNLNLMVVESDDDRIDDSDDSELIYDDTLPVPGTAHYLLPMEEAATNERYCDTEASSDHTDDEMDNTRTRTDMEKSAAVTDTVTEATAIILLDKNEANSKQTVEEIDNTKTRTKFEKNGNGTDMPSETTPITLPRKSEPGSEQTDNELHNKKATTEIEKNATITDMSIETTPDTLLKKTEACSEQTDDEMDNTRTRTNTGESAPVADILTEATFLKKNDNTAETGSERQEEEVNNAPPPTITVASNTSPSLELVRSGTVLDTPPVLTTPAKNNDIADTTCAKRQNVEFIEMMPPPPTSEQVENRKLLEFENNNGIESGSSNLAKTLKTEESDAAPNVLQASTDTAVEAGSEQEMSEGNDGDNNLSATEHEDCEPTSDAAAASANPTDRSQDGTDTGSVQDENKDNVAKKTEPETSETVPEFLLSANVRAKKKGTQVGGGVVVYSFADDLNESDSQDDSAEDNDVLMIDDAGDDKDPSREKGRPNESNRICINEADGGQSVEEEEDEDELLDEEPKLEAGLSDELVEDKVIAEIAKMNQNEPQYDKDVNSAPANLKLGSSECPKLSCQPLSTSVTHANDDTEHPSCYSDSPLPLQSLEMRNDDSSGGSQEFGIKQSKMHRRMNRRLKMSVLERPTVDNEIKNNDAGAPLKQRSVKLPLPMHSLTEIEINKNPGPKPVQRSSSDIPTSTPARPDALDEPPDNNHKRKSLEIASNVSTSGADVSVAKRSRKKPKLSIIGISQNASQPSGTTIPSPKCAIGCAEKLDPVVSTKKSIIEQKDLSLKPPAKEPALQEKHLSQTTLPKIPDSATRREQNARAKRDEEIRSKNVHKKQSTQAGKAKKTVTFNEGATEIIPIQSMSFDVDSDLVMRSKSCSGSPSDFVGDENECEIGNTVQPKPTKRANGTQKAPRHSAKRRRTQLVSIKSVSFSNRTENDSDDDSYQVGRRERMRSSVMGESGSTERSGSENNFVRKMAEDLQHYWDCVFPREGGARDKVDPKLVATALTKILKLFRRVKRGNVETPIGVPDHGRSLLHDRLHNSGELKQVVQGLSNLIRTDPAPIPFLSISILSIIADGGNTFGVFDTSLIDLLVNGFYGTCYHQQQNTMNGEQIVGSSKEHRKPRSMSRRFRKQDMNEKVLEDVRKALTDSTMLKTHGLSLKHFKDGTQIASLLSGIVLGKMLCENGEARELMMYQNRLGRITAVMYRTLQRMNELLQRKSQSSQTQNSIFDIERNRQMSLLGIVMFVLDQTSLNHEAKEHIVIRSQVVPKALEHMQLLIRSGELHANSSESFATYTMRLMINIVHRYSKGVEKFARLNGVQIAIDLLALTIGTRTDNGCHRMFDVGVLCLALLVSLVDGSAAIRNSFQDYSPTNLVEHEHGAVAFILHLLKEMGSSNNSNCNDYEKNSMNGIQDGNMERKVITGYLCLLLGALVRQCPRNRQVIRNSMPNRTLSGLPEVIEDFLDFHHSVGVNQSDINAMYQRIVSGLKVEERQAAREESLALAQATLDEEQANDDEIDDYEVEDEQVE